MTIPQEILHTLETLMGGENLFRQEPMARHTSFQAGGPAELFVFPPHAEALRQGLELLAQAHIPAYVMGRGSNLLVLDGGIAGVVFCLGPQISRIRVEGHRITAEAGASLAALAGEAAANGLSGLEFAAGIPGSVGGAVAKNAGAYDGEMAKCLESARVLDTRGQLITLSRDELELGYRTSRVTREGLVVLSATFALNPANKEEIREKMRILNQKRREKQPLEFPSAGSTFKRPAGHFAGKLIEDAGLKGFTIGGAQVSEKHAGFVINRGQATAADILAVIDHCRKQVQQQFGVELEPEVKIWGVPAPRK